MSQQGLCSGKFVQDISGQWNIDDMKLLNKNN